MLTVELLPDSHLEEAMRATWRRLAAAGLPSLAQHPHPTNRPHVTVATAAVLPPLTGLATRLPLAVRVTGVVAFSGPRAALVRAVVPSSGLLSLHGSIWQELPAPRPWHAPGSWFPHLALALRMTPQERGAALSVLADLPDLEGELVAARVYDSGTREVRQLTRTDPAAS